jgi:hypothetical protein
MARDNSPKERQRKQLERKIGRRAPYDRILLVSEGSKTEPNYFCEIRAFFRLHTANVQVHPSDLGTAPHQVVRYAKELFEKGDRQKNIQPRAFEKVFALFDRDDHLTYFDALTQAESLNGKLRNDERKIVEFRAVASVPSFELWLLLHYEEIHAPIHRNEVIRRLKGYLPTYEKGAKGTFETTRQHLDAASQRAEELKQRFNAYDAPEPFTAVADVVSLLVALRK